jgi:hypothetical protein
MTILGTKLSQFPASSVDLPAAGTLVGVDPAGTDFRYSPAQVAVAVGGEITLESFGAIGNGVADDTAAITAAFAAAQANNTPLVGTSGKTYKMTGILSMEGSNVNFDGRGCTIASYQIANNNFFWQFTSDGVLAATTLTVDATQGDRIITVADPTDFVAGNSVLLLVTLASNGTTNGFITIIDTVVGNDIYLCDAIPPGFAISWAVDEQEVDTFVTFTNHSIKNVTFDGANATGGGSVIGLVPFYGRGILYENLKFTNWILGGGFDALSCFTSTFRNLYAYNCGSAGQSDIVSTRGTSRCMFDGVISDRAAGFGPSFKQGAYNQFVNIQTSRATNRACKFEGIVASSLVNYFSSGDGSVGLGITLGSRFNRFTNLNIVGTGDNVSSGGNRQGIWFTDSNDSYNSIVNATILGLTGSTVNDLQVFTSDSYNSFTNVRVRDLAHVVDGGTNNTFRNINGADWHAVDNATAVSALPNAATIGVGARAFVTDSSVTTFGSIVADLGGNKVPVYSDGTDWRVG